MVLNFGHFRVLIKRFLYKNRVYAYQINEYSSVYLIEFIDNNLSGSFLYSAHIYAEMNSHKSTFFQEYLSSKTEDSGNYSFIRTFNMVFILCKLEKEITFPVNNHQCSKQCALPLAPRLITQCKCRYYLISFFSKLPFKMSNSTWQDN